MQDVLEEYFGYQRARGRRSDNPTAQEFGYNDITINMQRTIKPKGNVHGRNKGHWVEVSDEPLSKRPPINAIIQLYLMKYLFIYLHMCFYINLII